MKVNRGICTHMYKIIADMPYTKNENIFKRNKHNTKDII